MHRRLDKRQLTGATVPALQQGVFELPYQAAGAVVGRRVRRGSWAGLCPEIGPEIKKKPGPLAATPSIRHVTPRGKQKSLKRGPIGGATA